MKHVFDLLIQTPFMEKLATPFRYRLFREFDSLAGQDLTVDWEDIGNQFRTNLEQFILTCRLRNIEPVLMTQASRLTLNPDPIIQKRYDYVEEKFGFKYEEFRQGHRDFNEIVRNVGKKHGVTVVDLEREVPQDATYLYDAVHYNDEGSLFVSGIIAESLKPYL